MTPSRQTLRQSLAIGLLASTLAGCKPSGGDNRKSAAPPPTAPNILLISIESLRTDHVGCYGCPRPTTPALDALARSAITFDNAWSTTSWTLSAHASLFTGLYPTATNVVRPKDRLDASYPTLAELLRDTGYDTAAVVSGPYLRRSFQLDQGFTLYDDSAVSPPDQPSIHDVTNPHMQQKLLAWLDTRAGQPRPFFLFAYFWDPHYDYIPPPPYNTMFLPPDAKPIDVTNYDNEKGKVSKRSSPQELAYVLSQYDGEIRATDDVLARVFDRLKKLGLWDNTVVLVTADHGEEFFDHGEKGHKNNLYVESVKVPLLLKPAGPAAPRRDPLPASLVDAFPTLLEAAHYPRKLPPHHGRSLLAPPAEQAAIYAELTTSWYFTRRSTHETWQENKLWFSLLEGRYRLVGMTDPAKKQELWSLFDETADPRELKPLGPPAADQLAKMKSRVQAWQKSMSDTARLLGHRSQAELTPAELKQLQSIGYLH